MYKIMIVEDDAVIAEAVKKHIEKWGQTAVCAKNFSDISGEFDRVAPQLVLMDISLPFYNGYHWCQEIRKTSKVPIVFLSSSSDNMNIVMAMNMGADDFIAKPFDLSVLTAKIQALLRRAYDFTAVSQLIECCGAVLNLSDSTITYSGTRALLTRNEQRIMQILMENKGKTVSRDVIINALWESDSFIDDNTLTVNVTRLRKKLADIGLEDFIKTRKGLGYIVE